MSQSDAKKRFYFVGVFCGLLSILLVLVAQTMGNVLQATNAINSGIGGPLLGLFSIAVFLPFVNTKGKIEICGSQ